MNKKTFEANHWLKSYAVPSETIQQVNGSPIGIVNREGGSTAFNFQQFIVQGWTGEALFSGASLSLQTIIDALADDAREQFETFPERNRSFKLMVFNEFKLFVEAKQLHGHRLSDFSLFWDHVSDPYSPYIDDLKEFKKIFCYRAVFFFIQKMKFLAKLSDSLELHFCEETIQNSLSFVNKIFKKNSSSELNATSLQSNQYSWFRPTNIEKEKMVSFISNLQKISMTELVKMISLMSKNHQTHQDFSHSLSHLSFGLFVNHLLVNFPLWLFDEKVTIRNSIPKALPVKFFGNHVESLSISHRLAQESSSHEKWKRIICPEFTGEGFFYGEYTRLTHELQFLCFLISYAETHQFDVVPFICQVFRDKQNTKSEMLSFFELEQPSNLYERIVVSLTDLPKNNPHHYLITQINLLQKNLKENGHVVVLTNQNLFVPSQSERVDQFLKNFKLEGLFHFESLKGKGEIPEFIYILRKKDEKSIQARSLAKIKETCATFSFEGNLSQFNKFSLITEELQKFFAERNCISTPIYQKEFGKELCFKFHQDAVLDGKLLSTINQKDTSKMYHPSFFKNLTTTCLTLDHFFKVDTIQPENGLDVPRMVGGNELLGLRVKVEEVYPLALVVNYSDSSNVKLEIIPSDTLKSKFEQNGSAFFQYFGLIPKQKDYNLNVFREYFQSPIGNQIIQIFLSGSTSKIKGKVSSLLVPKFFSYTQKIPVHLDGLVEFLSLNDEQILAKHPNELKQMFNIIQQTKNSLMEKNPWHFMGLLSQFDYHLEHSIVKFCGDLGPNSQFINFTNPLIKDQLVKLELKSIFPRNEDIFAEMKLTSPEEIHAPIEAIQLRHLVDGPQLEIMSSGKVLVILHAELNLLCFIQFILQRAYGLSISKVLTGLKIPNVVELKKIVDSYMQIEEVLVDLQKETKQLIAQILSHQITVK